MREVGWSLWEKGTLVRDRIPACRSASLSTKPKELSIEKRVAMKKAILARKLAELEKIKKQEEELTKTENLQTDEGRLNEERIAEQTKKLENLQKEKHKMFLLLKKALERDKKQQNQALKAQADARAHNEEVAQHIPSRRITNPPPANRIFPTPLISHGFSSSRYASPPVGGSSRWGRPPPLVVNNSRISLRRDNFSPRGPRGW